jgi:hypothetical protein
VRDRIDLGRTRQEQTGAFTLSRLNDVVGDRADDAVGRLQLEIVSLVTLGGSLI